MKNQQPQSPHIFLQAAASAVPRIKLETEELLRTHGSILSDDLIATIRRMGIDSRHVAVANIAAYVTGREATMDLESTSTTLAVSALRRCLDRAPQGGGDLGLLIAVTNTQARPLPGLAPEMVAAARDLLPSSITQVNMQGQGCSGLQKAVEVASWYLAANPGKRAAIVASEANSIYAPMVREDHYRSFSEIARGLPPDVDFMTELGKTGAMLQNFLFGDGASCLLLGCDEAQVEFGALRHLTNLQPDDQELVRIDTGGDGDGRPRFFMEPAVLSSGPTYAIEVVRELLASGAAGDTAPEDLSPLLLHTGSKKLLGKVCKALGVSPESPAVAAAYATLRTYANLSSASIGFMLAEGEFEPGVGLMAGFGGGFSATAGVLKFR